MDFNPATFCPSCPSYSFVDNKITFAGVLRAFMLGSDTVRPISYGWGEEWFAENLSDYEKRLIPRINRFKSMEQLVEDDFLRVLRDLKYEKSYSESTEQHYRHLIWIVYKAGIQAGLYPDKLCWEQRGCSGSGNARKEREAARKVEIVRKSFSLREEMIILRWLKSKLENIDSVTGLELGLILMFLFGLRNSEACAVTYNDFIRLSGSAEDFCCLYITKSAVLGSGRIKAGGKTSNAARIIPVYDFFYERMIIPRQELLIKKISSREVSLPRDHVDIAKLPVACKDNCFDGYSADDLSTAARKLFVELKLVDDEREAALFNSIYQLHLADADVVEKDPTAYLFRRNFATHLYALGLDESSIQFLMGHMIESSDNRRNYFSNPDVIYQLYLLFKEHPYAAYFSEGAETESAGRYQIRIKPNGGKEEFVHIVSEEPLNDSLINISANVNINIRKSPLILRGGYGKQINIRRQVRGAYKEYFIDEKKEGL